MLILLYYCSPSEDVVTVLAQLIDLVGRYPDDKTQVVGNINTKSFIWGQRLMYPRTEEVVTFALAHDFEIINKPNSAATLGHEGQSWIDLLIVRKCQDANPRPRDRHPKDDRLRWRPSDLVWDEFLQDLPTADMDIYDHDSLDLGVEHLESTLTKLCYALYVPYCCRQGHVLVGSGVRVSEVEGTCTEKVVQAYE